MYNVFLDRKFVALIYSGNAELKHKRGPELGYSVLSNQLIFQPILSNPLDFFISIISNRLKLSSNLINQLQF